MKNLNAQISENASHKSHKIKSQTPKAIIIKYILTKSNLT